MFRYTYVVYICCVLWVFCTTRFAYSKHYMKQFPRRKGKLMHSYKLPESAGTSTNRVGFLVEVAGICLDKLPLATEQPPDGD